MNTIIRHRAEYLNNTLASKKKGTTIVPIVERKKGEAQRG